MEEQEKEAPEASLPKIVSRIVKSDNPYGKTGVPNRRMKRLAQKFRPRSERITVVKPVRGVKPVRVVIRPGITMMVEDELLLLGALRELKNQRTNIRLDYATESSEVSVVLRTAPFIDKYYIINSDSEWEGIVGNDVGITVEEPPINLAMEAEKSIYDREHKAKVEEMEKLQASYEERGMKDLRAPIPFYNFQPHWHKSSGLLHILANELGINLVVPKTPIQPYGVVPKSEAQKIKNTLEKAGIGVKPFLVYDLSGESTPLPLLQVLMNYFKGIELVSMAEVEAVAGKGIIPLLVLADHDNCQYIVSPVSKLSCAAWAMTRTTSNPRWLRDRKRRGVIQLYTGSSPSWDGAHGENVYIVHRDNCKEESLPSYIDTASRYVINNPTFVNV